MPEPKTPICPLLSGPVVMPSRHRYQALAGPPPVEAATHFVRCVGSDCACWMADTALEGMGSCGLPQLGCATFADPNPKEVA